MWSIRAFAVTWLLGADLPQELIFLGRVAEGEAALGRVATADQERWRESRRALMQGRGALGDADNDRGYPYVPLPEWLLDCCTVGAEVRNPAVRVADDAVPDPRDNVQVSRAAGLDALTLRADQVVDVLRLVVEPRAQVLIQELSTEVRSADDSRHVTHHSWIMSGFLWSRLRHTWTLLPDQVPKLTRTWEQVSLGPNAHAIQWPLRRWGVATSRSFDEDRLLDLWVALDGMFKREDEKRQARQRVAQRVGRLLGADRHEQRRLNRELPRSHDIRNAVVHGRPDYTDAEVEDAIATVDEVLRRSLVALAAEQQRTDLTAESWSPARRAGPPAG